VETLSPPLSRPAEAPAPAPANGTRPGLYIVALASSAGGLHALTAVLSHLPADFPAAVVIVQHVEPSRHSLMPEILARRTPLLVTEAKSGDRLTAGHVYFAPPDNHLIVNADGTLSLSHAAAVRFVRPSADVLFQSLAESFGERAVAVVLSGAGSDGAAGARTIRAQGGTVIAQDQETAAFFGMPGAAIGAGQVDFILPLEAIPAALVALTSGGQP